MTRPLLLTEADVQYNNEVLAAAIPGATPVRPLKRRRTPHSSGSGSPASEPPDGDQMWLTDRLSVDDPKRQALRELKKYTAEYLASEKDEFWQRQSKKAVLSIAVCRRRNGTEKNDWVTYRGMNTEVALQTGSLCAERAALAQAFSNFQSTLDVLCVATIDPQDKKNPLWPCGVCQTWFAKLHSKNPDIEVLAVSDLACDRFSVQVNGVVRFPPAIPTLNLGCLTPLPVPCSHWARAVQCLSDEVPWETEHLVYVDGAWSFLHDGHLSILRAAGRMGTHLLVGIHTDETVRQATGADPHEPYARRLARLSENINVASILADAPWGVSREMIEELGIKTVVTGSVSKLRDIQRYSDPSDTPLEDPYLVARHLDILQVIPSSNPLTEWQVLSPGSDHAEPS